MNPAPAYAGQDLRRKKPDYSFIFPRRHRQRLEHFLPTREHMVAFTTNSACDCFPAMVATKDSGRISRKPTTKPTGPVRNGFVVASAPEYDIRRIKALQKKRYRRSPAYQRHLKARKVDVICRRRVFNEQERRRKIAVSISIEEYSTIVRTACWCCGEFTYEGYSVVDRVQNAGKYQSDNVVAKFLAIL